MELDEDNHLCLRCGRTINGLENYVSHRQQQCRLDPTPISPLLSDSSNVLASSDSQELNVSSQDIYRLSASDFFLSLNLQSTSSDNPKNSSESFCSKLEIPPLENALASSYAEIKASMCPDGIVEEESNSISEIGMGVGKWDCGFKMNATENTIELNSCRSRLDSNFTTTDNILQIEPEFEIHNLCDISEDIHSDLPVIKNTNPTFTNECIARKPQGSNSYISEKPETAFCQNQNKCIGFCSTEIKHFICNFCGYKYSFHSTFLDHLIICNLKRYDFRNWRSKLFENEPLFIQSLPFKCALCSFFFIDSLLFLNHLKTASHCQNAAGLKNHLICLPCGEECSANDEMIEHFSNVHLHAKINYHPVVVAEMKKSLHCHFCLLLVKQITSLQPTVDKLLKCDIQLIKQTFSVLILCAFGISKCLLNSVIQKISSCFDFVNKIQEFSNEASISFRECENDEISTNSNTETVFVTHNCGSSSLSHNQNTIKQLGDSVSNKKLSFKNIGGKVKRSRNKVFRPKKNKYNCTKCYTSFASTSSLQRHLRLHKNDQQSKVNAAKINTGDTDIYLCDKCGYEGKNAHQLTKHKRSHTGERPFKCADCKYSCSLSSQLLRHKRLHTGSKPYKCPYCSYVCNTQENLRKHVLKTKKHKGKKLYPCKHCDFNCNLFMEYKEHLLIFHSEYFPNKEKDIASSSVAGIYDKI